MILTDERTDVAAFLSAEECEEIDRIKADESVAGYALFNEQGEILEINELAEDIVAVFANVFDLARRLGKDLGESDCFPMAIYENRSFEVLAIALSASRMVVIRRKGAKKLRGLRSVG
ncbi:MAG: hypothetical protein AAF713_10790 [Pseudomonadota bacterium]